jgi:hypothetical protein
VLRASVRTAFGVIRRILIERSERTLACSRFGCGASDKDRRGLTLLREWLTAEQLVQFNRCGHFEVTGSASGKRYRISYGVATNVHELDQNGRPIAGWCFVPDQPLVPGDVVLAQKIALETNETGALAVARPFRPTWS